MDGVEVMVAGESSRQGRRTSVTNRCRKALAYSAVSDTEETQ